MKVVVVFLLSFQTLTAATAANTTTTWSNFSSFFQTKFFSQSGSETVVPLLQFRSSAHTQQNRCIDSSSSSSSALSLSSSHTRNYIQNRFKLQNKRGIINFRTHTRERKKTNFIDRPNLLIDFHIDDLIDEFSINFVQSGWSELRENRD